jgi:FixJ family two-component response regulator
MRIVDGKSALQNILKDEVLKQVPVIILTTASGIETKEKYQKLGAKDFYTKPYSFQTMTQMIAEITEKWLNKSI